MTTYTPGPWFVSGVRFKMNGGEWQSINRYDEAKKKDENIACVGYDPRTGVGFADARLIAAAPEMLDALKWAEGVIGLYSKDPAPGSGISLIRNAIAKAEGRP